jgi:hypothetical protein
MYEYRHQWDARRWSAVERADFQSRVSIPKVSRIFRQSSTLYAGLCAAALYSRVETGEISTLRLACLAISMAKLYQVVSPELQ